MASLGRCMLAMAGVVLLHLSGCGKSAPPPPSAGGAAPAGGLATPASATTPPEAVAQFAVGDVRDCLVELRWQPSADGQSVVGYRIFRGMADGFDCEPKAQIGEAAGGTTAYVDHSPPMNQTTWYAVRAIDTKGELGTPTYIKVAVPPNQPPLNTLELDAVHTPLGPFLRLWGTRDADLAAIEILRAAPGEADLQKIGEITDLKRGTYSDLSAKVDQPYRYSIRVRDAGGLTSVATPPQTVQPGLFMRRINCGGHEFTGDDGIAWEPDFGDSRGTGWQIKQTRVSGAYDLEPIYHSERWSSKSLWYDFTVKPGRYLVVLHFAETNETFAYPGKRTFDVYLNDRRQFQDVDIYKAVGGNAAYRVTAEVEIPKRNFRIKLDKVTGGPAIKGIELRQLPDATSGGKG